MKLAVLTHAVLLTFGATTMGVAANEQNPPKIYFESTGVPDATVSTLQFTILDFPAFLNNGLNGDAKATAKGTCTTPIPPTQTICTLTDVFEGKGSIMTQGVFGFADGKATFAVVGGTGSFAKAQGTMTVKAESADFRKFSHEYHLESGDDSDD